MMTFRLKNLIFYVICIFLITLQFYWYPIRLKTNENSKHTKDELDGILLFLFQNEAFLVDIDLLHGIENNSHSDKKYDKMQAFEKLVFQKSNRATKAAITFGILNDSMSSVDLKKQIDNFDLNCFIENSHGYLLNKKIITNVYLSCDKVIIQLAIFYRRGDYLWIGADENKAPRNKWFGDTARAVQVFKLAICTRFEEGLIHVPSNIKKFLYDYKYSKFLECNQTIANKIKKQKGESYVRTEESNKLIASGLKYLSKIIESFYKPYSLYCGTLLGWYRDCGIIPHTTDVDISMRIEDYDHRIKRAFLGNKKLRLTRTFGTLNKGFEMRLRNSYQFDLFFFHQINKTHWWTGYHFPKRFFKNVYSVFDEFCSAELLGSKYLIPCDPLKVINEDYGENWIIPKAKGFGWKSINWRDSDVFNNTDWPNKSKLYDTYGYLEKENSIDYLNDNNEGIRENVTDIFDDIEQ